MDNALSVEQATQTLYTRLSEVIGWKLLKSQRCLKRTVGELVFEIDFYSSKWNCSFESVQVNAALSETQKQQVIQYLNGEKSAAWTLNRSNLRFIIDNRLVDLQM